MQDWVVIGDLHEVDTCITNNTAPPFSMKLWDYVDLVMVRAGVSDMRSTRRWMASRPCQIPTSLPHTKQKEGQRKKERKTERNT